MCHLLALRSPIRSVSQRLQKEQADLAERQRKREETAFLQERLSQLERELEDAKRVCVYVSGYVCERIVLVSFFSALFLSQRQEQKAEPGEGVEGDEDKEPQTPTQVSHGAKVV